MHPSTEVHVEKKRRHLTAAYKIRVLETVKSLKAEGGTSIGSYLRTRGSVLFDCPQMAAAIRTRRLKRGSLKIQRHLHWRGKQRDQKTSPEISLHGKEAGTVENDHRHPKKKSQTYWGSNNPSSTGENLRAQIKELAQEIPVALLCQALDEPRAAFYRSQSTVELVKAPRTSHRKLSETEEQQIMDVLNSNRFCDLASGEISAILLYGGPIFMLRTDDV